MKREPHEARRRSAVQELRGGRACGVAVVDVRAVRKGRGCATGRTCTARLCVLCVSRGYATARTCTALHVRACCAVLKLHMHCTAVRTV